MISSIDWTQLKHECAYNPIKHLCYFRLYMLPTQNSRYIQAHSALLHACTISAILETFLWNLEGGRTTNLEGICGIGLRSWCVEHSLKCVSCLLWFRFGCWEKSLWSPMPCSRALWYNFINGHWAVLFVRRIYISHPSVSNRQPSIYKVTPENHQGQPSANL